MECSVIILKIDMMKYLKKSDRTPSEELIDLFDLQIELLNSGLENDLVRQYTDIVNSFHIKVESLLDLVQADYEKFRRVFSDTLTDYKKKFVEGDEDFFISGTPILSVHPLVKRMVLFNFSAIELAYNESDQERFNYFYNELFLFFRKLTDKKLNKEVISKVDFFTGEDIEVHEARLIQIYHEVMRYFISLIKRKIAVDTPTIEQKSNLAKLYFHLHFELILDEEFEPLMIDSAIDYWERLFTDFIYKDDVEDVCVIISRELHTYSDQLNRERQELSTKEYAPHESLVRSCNEIISRRDFIEFEKKLNLSDLKRESKLYKNLMNIGTLGIKTSLLRMALLRVVGKAVARDKEELIVKMLFARQPVKSNFINSNSDFFPMEIDFIKRFLRIYNNQREFGINPLLYDNVDIEINKVVFIWLYRNTYWRTKRDSAINSFNLGDFENGLEKQQITNALTKLVTVADSFSEGELPPISLNESPILNPTIFRKLVSQEITRISSDLQDAISKSEIDPDKMSGFLTKVEKGIESFPGLFNLLEEESLIESKEHDVFIENEESFDKTPFLPDKVAPNFSLNADVVYPKLCADNFSLKRDYALARELKKHCNPQVFTTTEMENYLLNHSFEGKIIITHYLHLGFEILKESFNYGEGEFLNKKGEKFKIFQINSFVDWKFVFILDESVLEGLIKADKPTVTLHIDDEDEMKAVAKIVSRFRVEEPKGMIGEFFALR